MQLKQFLSTLDRGEPSKIAKELGLSISHLSQMASGSCPISPIRACEIEFVTGKKVMRWDLRPKDWHLIWPELIDTAGAPQVSEVNHVS